MATNSDPDSSEPSNSAGTPRALKQHPLFTSEVADIILCSSDGYGYRVHSYTLRLASGFFRDMFSLPQSSSRAPYSRTLEEEKCLPLSPGASENETGIYIPTHESSDVLTLFLVLLTGAPIHTPLHKWGTAADPYIATDTTSADSSSSSSFTTPSDLAEPDAPLDLIERVLYLAENWDAPGPISYIRLGLRSPELLERHALRLYAIACHFDWEYERNLTARHTLKLDLLGTSESAIQETLERLSSKDVLCLLNLRRRRRDRFRELLDDPGRFAAGNSDEYICARCGVTQLDNKTWRALKEAMVSEMDQNALGDSIVGCAVNGIGGTDVGGTVGGGLLGWPEADSCFGAMCMKEGCGGFNYDRYVTLKRIQECVDILPWELEDTEKHSDNRGL